MDNTPVSNDLIFGDFPVGELRKDMLQWFARESRDLPWRRNPSLYGTWISEIMLQQTTVATVIPYWNNFIARFPNVKMLAEAPETEVLSQWSGLGYYRRARNLHAAAKQIMLDFDGTLPRTSQEWKSLSGVGDYAAGAIASLGLGEVVPAVDVNARRVITRLLIDNVDILPALKPRFMHSLASRMVDPREPGLWNEAVMELGALHCTVTNPSCHACPVQKYCRTLSKGLVAAIPAPVSRRSIQKVVMAQWLLLADSGLLLLPPSTPVLEHDNYPGTIVRADLSNLHHGLWSFPQTPWFADEPSLTAGAFQQQFAQALASGDNPLIGVRSLQPVVCGNFIHGITHHRIRVENLILDMRGLDKGTIIKGLKFLETALGAKGTAKSLESRLDLTFLPLEGESPGNLPVSKMIDKAVALAKKTII